MLQETSRDDGSFHCMCRLVQLKCTVLFEDNRLSMLTASQFVAQAAVPNTAKDRKTARPSPSTFVIFSRTAAAFDTGAASSVVWLEHSFTTRFRPIAVPLKAATWRTTGFQGASPLPCGPPPPPPQTPTVEQGNSHGCGALQSPPVVYTTQ